MTWAQRARWIPFLSMQPMHWSLVSWVFCVYLERHFQIGSVWETPCFWARSDIRFTRVCLAQVSVRIIADSYSRIVLQQSLWERLVRAGWRCRLWFQCGTFLGFRGGRCTGVPRAWKAGEIYEYLAMVQNRWTPRRRRHCACAQP